jgi:SRSO17 transposase
MAERIALGAYDQLHHFVSAGVWDMAPVETELLIQADKLVGGRDAVLVIDDTAVLKKGTHSVGVAPQYCSALGKIANCQTLVSLTLAHGEVPVMAAMRLFLPESWTDDRARLKRAGVPVEYRAARTKPEVALAEIDRVIAAGVRFGCVVADAGYGLSARFRQGLTARKLSWAVGIPRHVKVYPADVQMIRPVARRGRPPQRIPDTLSVAAEDVLTTAKWQNISWRTGTKGKLRARFAAVRVRVADGSPQRIKDKTHQHLPGEQAWLIGEHRASGERKYYLANLPAKTDLRTLAATIKARWVCEQAHQQLKEELGLDHFEGRSWQGLHRHALMTMIAYAFLQYRRLATARRKKKNQRPTAPANSARRTSRHSRALGSTASTAMPTLPKMDMWRAAA